MHAMTCQPGRAIAPVARVAIASARGARDRGASRPRGVASKGRSNVVAERKKKYLHHLRLVARRASGGDAAGADEDDDPYTMGGEFFEEWEREMVKFWRLWNEEHARHRIRDNDIVWMVRLGREIPAFAKPETVAAGAKKLRALLPDAHVPIMIQREPGIVADGIDFVRASRSILDLQDLLCSSDHCRDVTRVIERAPRLLLCEDVRAEVNAAKRRLEEIAPSCDAKKAISEYPEEIITRIQLYDEYSDLPVSLQNIIAETSDDDENEAADAYDARWNDWERESSGGDGVGLVSNPGRRGLDENSWDNQYASPDSAEWMIDGYWETEESESDDGGGSRGAQPLAKSAYRLRVEAAAARGETLEEPAWSSKNNNVVSNRDEGGDGENNFEGNMDAFCDDDPSADECRVFD